MEHNIFNCFVNTFTESEVLFCLYHVVSAFQRKAESLGIWSSFTDFETEQLSAQQQFWCLVKSTPYLGLDDKNCLEAVIDILKSEVESMVSNKVENVEKVDEFLTYLIKNYLTLEGPFSVKKWSRPITNEVIKAKC